MTEENLYKWTDNPTVSGVAKCDTDVLNDCLMHLKYENGGGLNDKITNCLLEVPQNIKLELNEGVLTLKAGSKVIVPNGAGVFDEVVIENDLTTTGVSYQYPCFIMYNNRDKTISVRAVSQCQSGTSTPTSAISGVYIYYNTSENKVYLYKNNAWTALAIALPLCIVNMQTATPYITAIDQVFNGFGYIGSTIFCDKGVKGLIPNGRNEDGTLRNIEITVNKVLVNTANASYTAEAVLFLKSENVTFLRSTFYDYVESENLIYNRDGSNKPLYFINSGKVSFSSGVITSFQPKLPFRAVDYNDLTTNNISILTPATGDNSTKIATTAWVNSNKSTIASWSFPDWSKKESKILDTTYTANKNGFILFTSDYSGGVAGGASLKINGEEVIYDYHGLDADDCHCYAPVAKNDTYNITCAHSAKYYYFVPCKEV